MNLHSLKSLLASKLPIFLSLVICGRYEHNKLDYFVKVECEHIKNNKKSHDIKLIYIECFHLNDKKQDSFSLLCIEFQCF
jgi:hypothetical protein